MCRILFLFVNNYKNAFGKPMVVVIQSQLGVATRGIEIGYNFTNYFNKHFDLAFALPFQFLLVSLLQNHRLHRRTRF